MNGKSTTGSDTQALVIKQLKRELAATRAELSSYIDKAERAIDSLQCSEHECKELRQRLNLIVENTIQVAQPNPQPAVVPPHPPVSQRQRLKH